MQPLKPDDKKDILTANPAADAVDLQDYEELLARRFTMDPDQPLPAQDPSAGAVPPTLEQELKRLHDKIYNRKPGP
ncbi:hypothetical protein LRH25_20265 [Ideonella azotifigens]|uniref:Uncharacterized protein n=1 Tax=Ideonella azotifigens TaxID=513160 RepID=A0ABN1JZM0_9BURK|nr:hypothetical protein [Ideonella azotifigens]MCD2342665.1 hypothetical protein [Ideonella azotifigens]